jgi:hypothetical protein
MAGLDPAIHVLFCRERFKTWMPGTGPGMTEFIAPSFSAADHVIICAVSFV